VTSVTRSGDKSLADGPVLAVVETPSKEGQAVNLQKQAISLKTPVACASSFSGGHVSMAESLLQKHHQHSSV